MGASEVAQMALCYALLCVVQAILSRFKAREKERRAAHKRVASKSLKRAHRARDNTINLTYNVLNVNVTQDQFSKAWREVTPHTNALRSARK